MTDFDQIFNIKTDLIDEWCDFKTILHDHYFRNEPTSYIVIEELFNYYQPQKEDHLLDVGSGRGRMLFYTNYFYDIKVTGIEYNQTVYNELVKNYKSYTKKYPDKNSIDLYYGSGEDYEIKPEQNIIYLFNPFSTAIFKKFMANVYESLSVFPRRMDLILYYPNSEWLTYLGHLDYFEPFQEIRLADYQKDSRECFMIYRYEPY